MVHEGAVLGREDPTHPALTNPYRMPPLRSLPASAGGLHA